MSRDLGCVHAVGGLAIDPDGRTKLCCMSRQFLTNEDGSQINISDHPLEATWTSPLRQEVVDALARGEEHPNCKHCWAEERGHRRSKRIRDNEMGAVVRVDQPVLLDLKLGNTCNLKCRTCWSGSSSKWMREEYELGDAQKGHSFKQFAERYSRHMQSFRVESPVWNTLRRWSANAIHMELYGGEPMMIERHWELLHHAIDSGHAGNQTIHYNTNGTIFPEEKLDLYKHFKKLDLSFSVDGVGAQFEYLRHPAKWEEVRANIMRWQEGLASRGIDAQITACITISLFNVYDVDTVYNELRAMGLWSFLNIVHQPAPMCITNLPDALKPIVAEKLRAGFGPNLGFSGLEGILGFMGGSPSDPEMLRRFFWTMKRHDEYRGESFDTTFGDYARLIAPYR